jgi:hypothetical protein
VPPARLRSAATLCLAALVVGCGGGGSGSLVSLDEADPSGGYWAIQAECPGGRLQVEFDPGERLSVAGLGHASSAAVTRSSTVRF